MNKQKQDIYKTGLTQKFGRLVLSKGFTLVELIVVITILAILGTIAIMAFEGYSKNARDSVRVTDVSNIMKGVELYSLKAGIYPEPDEVAVYTGGTSSSIKQGKIGNLVSSNISISGDLVDPLTQKKYVYSVFGNSKYYQIGAEKENEQTLLIDSAYAEGGKIIVKGNYIFDPSLPSLIVVPSSVTGSGIFDPNVCFVVDGGVNTFDSCVETKNEMVLKNQDANLVGYWDMETLTGTMLKDLSGNGNDGVFTGGMLYESALTGGILANGLIFNGSGNFVEINYNNILKPQKITMSATFYGFLGKSRFEEYPYIISNGDPSSNGGLYNGIFLNVNKGKLLSAFFDTDGGLHSFTGGNLTENSKHIGVTSYDGKILKLYLDGILVNSIDVNKTILWESEYKGLLIGRAIYNSDSSSNSEFDGIIDDVKIYNRALSDEEILQQAKIAGF